VAAVAVAPLACELDEVLVGSGSTRVTVLPRVFSTSATSVALTSRGERPLWKAEGERQREPGDGLGAGLSEPRPGGD